MKAVLLIDDFFGRTIAVSGGTFRHRLCARLRVVEIDGSSLSITKESGGEEPVAVRFIRGQRPAEARVGDLVQNDLEGTLAVIAQGVPSTGQRWDLVLLDLSFNTGRVTPRSHRDFPGMPEASPKDQVTDRLFGLEILRRLAQQPTPPPVVMFSAIDDQAIQSQVSEFAFVLGWLPRIDPSGDVKLRRFLSAAGGAVAVRTPTFTQLLATISSFHAESSISLESPLTQWRNANANVLRELLLWAFTRAGTRGGAPALLPAMKLLTGDPKLTTTKAADLLKRLVRQGDVATESLLAEPIIAAAYRKAVRLREATSLGKTSSHSDAL